MWRAARATAKRPLWVLAALSGAVRFLLACANLANLFIGTRHHTGTRDGGPVAIGGTPSISAALVESLLLAVIGTAWAWVAFIAEPRSLRHFQPIPGEFSGLSIPDMASPRLWRCAHYVLTCARVGMGACDSKYSADMLHTDRSRGLGCWGKTGVAAQVAGRGSDGFGIVPADGATCS